MYRGQWALSNDINQMRRHVCRGLTTVRKASNVWPSPNAVNLCLLSYSLALGTVGIGTTSPSYTLDILGVARASSSINSSWVGAVTAINTSSMGIAASFNVASVTKSATGRYTVTWTTPFSSSNYAVMCTSMQSGVNIRLCGVEDYSTR